MFLAPLAIGGFLLFTAIGGEVVLQLWNWLLPGRPTPPRKPRPHRPAAAPKERPTARDLEEASCQQLCAYCVYFSGCSSNFFLQPDAQK